MRALPLLFLLLFSLSTLINGLSMDFDLIHRDSPLSPFYNSSKTLSELTRNARLRALHRSKRLLLQTDILPPVVIQGEGEYLMRIYIGSPPVETWAIADTGSDLIWVQCLPCDTCYPQNAPIFDPKKSSTYRVVSCHSKPCTFFPKGGSACGISKQCAYGYAYADNSTTSGELARDFINFGGKSVSFLKSPLLFGCGNNNTGIWPSQGSGLVGLGRGPLSLVSQLGPEIDHKFSYCFVPYFSNSTGKLKLGKEVKISGSNGAVSTPYMSDSTQTSYYLTLEDGIGVYTYDMSTSAFDLEGITVGKKTVKTGHQRNGNTLLDSGSTWFSLESSFYTKIEALVREAIGVEEVKNPPEPFSWCYSNKYAESIKRNFPDFVVHFKGADVSLKPDHNIFFPQDDFLCIAILPLDGSGFVYGNVPQVNFQVEYDLEAKKISFAHADCSKR